MSRTAHRLKILGVLLCLALATRSALVFGQSVRPLGHSIPSYIGFSDPNYEVAADEPIAKITLIRTGDHRQSVIVGFSTEDGTARAGQDYAAVSRELLIPAGVGVTTVAILIHAADLTDRPATIRLRLWVRDPETLIIQGDATLSLVPRTGPFTVTTPALQIQANESGAVVIAWPANGVECVLEKSESLRGGDWKTLEAPPENVDGHWIVKEPISAGQSFYRLRAL